MPLAVLERRPSLIQLFSIFINILLPVFALVVTGYVAGPRLQLDARTLTKFAYYVLVPAFIFNVFKDAVIPAGLAARMARLCGDEKTAALLQGAEPHEAADPAFDGGSDARATAILRHVDLLTVRPRDATRGDVQVLVAAGLDEADIVRLAELVSFMAYLLRLVAGLRALEEGR